MNKNFLDHEEDFRDFLVQFKGFAWVTLAFVQQQWF